jgi:anti-anti-sigma factor
MQSAFSSAITHETWPDYEALQVFGDLDLSNGDALQSHLDHTIALNKPLVIDLMRCDYMSCSEIGRIIRAKQSFTKPFLVLVSACSNVERFMQLSGAASVLTVYSLARPDSGKRAAGTAAVNNETQAVAM